MTVEERKALAGLSKRTLASSAEPRKAKVAKMRAEEADAERLRKNNAWFSAKL
jgi:hypothetical protein